MQEKWFFKTPIFKPHRTEFLTQWQVDCAWCGIPLQVAKSTFELRDELCHLVGRGLINKGNGAQ